MKKLMLLVFLFFVLSFAMPASAQSPPDITGTWTGTGTVNSGDGIVSLDVTFVVTSQSGGDFVATVQIETSNLDPSIFYGRMDSLSSLWQFHGTAGGPFGASRVQGYYTPAVLFLSPAKITLDGDLMGQQETDESFFGAPCVFHVTLTKN